MTISFFAYAWHLVLKVRSIAWAFFAVTLLLGASLRPALAGATGVAVEAMPPTEAYALAVDDGGDAVVEPEESPEGAPEEAPEPDASLGDDPSEAEVAGVMEAAWIPASAPMPVSVPVELTVPELIVDAAARYGLPSEWMLRVAWCESKWDPWASGPGGASGVYQFIPRTWAWASVGAGVAGASPFDAEANVEAAAWLMATQGFHHWGCR